MNNRYKNKYRIASARASWWDYGANAAYFVTICTKDRISFFGQVADGVVELSGIGEVAQQCWMEIPKHFPFAVLGEHVIMPNHVHGIIIIDKSAETQDFASLQSLPPTKDENKTFNKFGPQSKNLASIIRGFKIGVTKSARLINPDFAWQSRYHDRIVRNQQEHERIARYIQDNPDNWAER